jgi:HEAT repeat protein
MRTAPVTVTTLVALALCAGADPGTARAADARQDEVDGLRKVLAGTDDNARYQALLRLQDLGPKAAAAAPDLTLLFTAKSEDIRLNAAIALGKIGKAAVPELRKPLAGDDEDQRYYALSAVGWIGPAAKDLAPQVIGSLNHKSESVRRKAAYALGSIAAAPEDAVGALIKLLGDSNGDVRKAASDSLARYGDRAVPALLREVAAKDIGLRVGVIRALGAIGTDARDAVPPLRAALLANDYPEYKDAGVTAAAAEALSKIGKAALAALADGVKSQHADVRRLSVAALGKAGADAVPHLVDALGDANVDVRRQAAQVLGPMRINDKMVVLGFAFALKDSDEQVRYTAAVGLNFLGAGAKLATVHLLDALQDGNANVRVVATNVLRNIRPDTPEAFKKLSQLVKHENAGVRQSAVQLLGPFGADALPLVSAGLKDGDTGVRTQAVFALQNMQGDLSAALPLLLPLLKSDNVNLRQATVYALGRTGAKGVPHLMDALKDGDRIVRIAALNGLRLQGPAAVKAIPELTERFKSDPDVIVRRNIPAVLMALGSEGQTALFTHAKGHPDQFVRRSVLISLGGFKGAPRPTVEAKLVIPFLIASLKDTYANNRTLACGILGSYGPEAKDAVPALTELANDPNTNLRMQAQNALKLIQGK